MFNLLERPYPRIRVVDQRAHVQLESDSTYRPRFFGCYYYEDVSSRKYSMGEQELSVLIKFQRGYDLTTQDIIDRPMTNLFIHLIDSTTDQESLRKLLLRIHSEASTPHQQVVFILDDTEFQSPSFSCTESTKPYSTVRCYWIKTSKSLAKSIEEAYADYFSLFSASFPDFETADLAPWGKIIESFRYIIPTAYAYNFQKPDLQQLYVEPPNLHTLKAFPFEFFLQMILMNESFWLDETLQHFNPSKEIMWDCDENLFLVLCVIALYVGSIECVKILYKHASTLGVQLKANSLEEFLDTLVESFCEKLINHYHFKPLSDLELEYLKTFDASEYRQSHSVNDSVSVQIPKDPASSPGHLDWILQQFDIDNMVPFQLTLLACIHNGPKSDKHAIILYSRIISCLQLAFLKNRFDIVYFTFAYLPLIHGIPRIANNNPYEFFNAYFILNVVRNVSRDVQESPHQVKQKVPTSESLSYFTALESGRLVKETDFAKAYVCFLLSLENLIKRICTSTDLKVSQEKCGAKPNTSTRLMRRLFEPRQQTISFEGDPFEEIIDAIVTDNRALACACLSKINKIIPISETLRTDGFIYRSKKYNIKTPSDDVIGLIIQFGSFAVLSAFLEFPGTAHWICRYLADFYSQIEDITLRAILRTIVANGESGDFSVLHSAEALAVSCARQKDLALFSGDAETNPHLTEFENIFTPLVLQVLSSKRQLVRKAKLMTEQQYDSLLNEIRIFLEVHVPHSKALLRVALPLAEKTSNQLQNDLRRFPVISHQMPLWRITSQARSIQNLLKIINPFFNRIYCLSENGHTFFVRIMCLGYLVTSENLQVLVEQLKNASLVGIFSGRSYHVQEPLVSRTMKEFDKLQSGASPDIFPTPDSGTERQYRFHGSREGSFRPYGISYFKSIGEIQYCGFFGTFKASNNSDKAYVYHALYTGACAVGVPLYAEVINSEGQIKQVSLTDPDTVIEDGFHITRIWYDYDEHIDERSAREFFEKNMPMFASKLQNDPKPTLFAVNILFHYLHNLMHLNLQGKFENRNAFIDAASIIFRQIKIVYKTYMKVGTEYGLDVNFISPFDKIDYSNLFNDHQNTNAQGSGVEFSDENYDFRSFAENLAEMMERIPGQTPKEKEEKLVRELLSQLQSPSQSATGDATKTVYENLADTEHVTELFQFREDTDNTTRKYSPLQKLNRLDYSATLAVCQRLCDGKGKLLGILPINERQVFDGYKDIFANDLDTLLWVPSYWPQPKVELDPKQQTKEAKDKAQKRAKPFFMDYGIRLLCETVPEAQLFKQMAAYAFAFNIPQLLAYAYQGLASVICSRATGFINVAMNEGSAKMTFHRINR